MHILYIAVVVRTVQQLLVLDMGTGSYSKIRVLTFLSRVMCTTDPLLNEYLHKCFICYVTNKL